MKNGVGADSAEGSPRSGGAPTGVPLAGASAHSQNGRTPEGCKNLCEVNPPLQGEGEAQFRAAGQLICAAVELDWAKRGFAPHLRTAAIGVVRELYKLAEELAGERIEELFSAEDRGCAAPEKTVNPPGWAAVAGGLQ